MKDILHFSHANGFPAGTYRVLFESLSAHYDVRSIDRIGHNPDYPVTDNWRHLESELIHYFERHYNQPVIAVGHSLGGLLSLMVAVKRPDLIKALIMLDSPALSPLEANGLRLVKRLGMVDKVTPAGRTEGRRSEWPSTAEAMDYFRGKSLLRYFDERCLKDYVQSGTAPTENGVALRFDPEIEMKIYRTVPHNLRVRSGLRVPGAAVGGEHSKVFRRLNGAYMQSRLGMKVRWLPGSHMFPLERPEQTAAVIHQLLGELLA